MPELIQSDIRSDVGGIRELITDNIENGYEGVLTSSCDYNWSIIGCDWDSTLHEEAVQLIHDGKISLLSDTDKSGLNEKAITVNDLE